MGGESLVREGLAAERNGRMVDNEPPLVKRRGARTAAKASLETLLGESLTLVVTPFLDDVPSRRLSSSPPSVAAERVPAANEHSPLACWRIRCDIDAVCGEEMAPSEVMDVKCLRDNRAAVLAIVGSFGGL